MNQRALWLPTSSKSLSDSSWLVNQRLEPGTSYNEAWLQDLLFQRPELIPISTIDPGSPQVIPVCRELPLPSGGRRVFLDILGVARTGRLTLVECKLWRNPQARREVIGQILEYGALLQRWSYGDLTARLKTSLGWKGPNPLFEHVKAVYADLDESTFVDGVSHSLARGDFNLLVAGDGIRTDIEAIKSFLDGQSGLASRIALVEFQIWADKSSGATFVIPTVPVRTTIIRHRVVVSADGLPMQIRDEEVSDAEEVQASSPSIDKTGRPDGLARRVANREFWNEFIRTLVLDHPDQAGPRHGGDNWVKLDFPAPVQHLTTWRGAKGVLGVFITLKGEQAFEVFEALKQEADALREETQLDLVFHDDGERPSIGARKTGSSDDEPSQQLDWLRRSTNAYVNAFRPRLSQLSREE